MKRKASRWDWLALPFAIVIFFRGVIWIFLKNYLDRHGDGSGWVGYDEGVYFGETVAFFIIGGLVAAVCCAIGRSPGLPGVALYGALTVALSSAFMILFSTTLIPIPMIPIPVVVPVAVHYFVVLISRVRGHNTMEPRD